MLKTGNAAFFSRYTSFHGMQRSTEDEKILVPWMKCHTPFTMEPEGTAGELVACRYSSHKGSRQLSAHFWWNYFDP